MVKIFPQNIISTLKQPLMRILLKECDNKKQKGNYQLFTVKCPRLGPDKTHKIDRITRQGEII